MTEACRREFPERNYERCGEPAEFIVWGKLFPKEALGPRCYDCAFEQAGPHGLRPSNPQGYAIYHLNDWEKEARDKAEKARELAGKAAYLDFDPDGDWDLLPENLRMTWEGNTAAGVEATLDAIFGEGEADGPDPDLDAMARDGQASYELGERNG